MNSNQNDQFIESQPPQLPPSRFHAFYVQSLFLPSPLLSSRLFFPPSKSFPSSPHHVPSPVAIAWHKRHPRIRAFVALLKVLSTPDRVSLCFTLELSDNKRETGARARERKREDREWKEGGKGALRGGRASDREERGGERESIIYTAASCRLDYFNFFPLFSSSLSSLHPNRPIIGDRESRPLSRPRPPFQVPPSSFLSSFLRLNVCDRW